MSTSRADPGLPGNSFQTSLRSYQTLPRVGATRPPVSLDVYQQVKDTPRFQSLSVEKRIQTSSLMHIHSMLKRELLDTMRTIEHYKINSTVSFFFKMVIETASDHVAHFHVHWPGCTKLQACTLQAKQSGAAAQDNGAAGGTSLHHRTVLSGKTHPDFQTREEKPVTTAENTKQKTDQGSIVLRITCLKVSKLGSENLIVFSALIYKIKTISIILQLTRVYWKAIPHRKAQELRGSRHSSAPGVSLG